MNILNNFPLPQSVVFIIRRIMEKGGIAYIVGGAIRDWILGIQSNDWDVATSLLPFEVQQIFSDVQTIPTGEKFGTITIVAYDMPIQVTTFRGEKEYSDHRHPNSISFLDDIESDLSRRDFTINAFAYNPYLKPGLVDPMNGLKDLHQSIIRAVGNPEQRFTEDPLRIMRGARFVSQLGFSMDSKTQGAALSHSHLLTLISRERIHDELIKLLQGKHVLQGLGFMYENNIINTIMPELNIYLDNIKTQHENRILLFNVVQNCRRDLILRLSALFHPIVSTGISQTSLKVEEILTRLRFKRNTICRVTKIIQYHKTPFSNNKEDLAYQLRKLVGYLGWEDTQRLIELKTAILSVQLNSRLEEQRSLDIGYMLLSEILHSNHPTQLSDLAINGLDLLQIGIGQDDSKEIGRYLNLALEWVLQKPDRNSKEYLLGRIKRKYNNENKTNTYHP